MTKQLLAFQAMEYIKQNYVLMQKTDTEFARIMSDSLEHEYSMAKVRAYRQALGIPNNASKPAAQPRKVWVVYRAGLIDSVWYSEADAANAAHAIGEEAMYSQHEVL
jgi:hypothetical protein